MLPFIAILELLCGSSCLQQICMPRFDSAYVSDPPLLQLMFFRIHGIQYSFWNGHMFRVKTYLASLKRPGWEGSLIINKCTCSRRQYIFRWQNDGFYMCSANTADTHTHTHSTLRSPKKKKTLTSNDQWRSRDKPRTVLVDCRDDVSKTLWTY